MSYFDTPIIKDTESDFFISACINFNNVTRCWSKNIVTKFDNEERSWWLTIVRTVYNKTAVYLSFAKGFDGSKGKFITDKIKARCDFYVSFVNISDKCPQDKYSFQTSSATSSTPADRKTVTNIYPVCEKVLLYSLDSVAASFYFEIRGTIKDVDDSFPINIDAIPINVLKNLESLLTDQKFCDVTFKTSDALLSAHKNILAAQSPVFKRMFSSEMKEKKQGIVINMESNIEGSVLKEMLRFMYGGRVENIEKMADKLLILADKYEIELLMTMCEKVLYDKLTISNAISTIKLADMHNAKHLRQLAEEFIIKNKKSLLDTAEFKSLTSTNPQIVIDILKANLT